MSNNQIDYRKQRSTELATTLLLDQVRKEANNGNLIGAVFIDLSKAFGTLGHSKLLAKLRAHGFGVIELEWFTNYLFQRSQRV